SPSPVLNDGKNMGIGNRLRIQGLLSAAIVFQTICWAEQAKEPDELKRPAAVPATNLLASFQIEKGFRIELAAPEQMVSSPVAMAFDENGRLFVVEMRDYPDRHDQVPHLGRVRLLDDQDGDGVFDTSTIYAENLAWPSAIAC